jgi:hypothetical protein
MFTEPGLFKEGLKDDHRDVWTAYGYNLLLNCGNYYLIIKFFIPLSPNSLKICMVSRTFVYIIGSGLLFTIFACKNNDKDIKNSLTGTWDIYAAEINGKPSDFMKNAWFVFQDDNYAQSNLFGENNSAPYAVEKGRLNIKAQEPLDLNISKLQNDTLFLEGKVKYYYMQYYLVRRK